MADEKPQESENVEKPVSTVFASFQEYFTTDQDIREEIRVAVRALEQTAREILTVLQGIHQGPSEAFKGISARGRELFGVAKEQYADLIKKVPSGQYYRFCDHWRFVNQRFAFLGALIVYTESERLISREELATILGVQLKREDGFHIELDDFLMGLLQLANELSRLAVNCVTSGDYSRPVRIAGFVAELDSGFRLLQLKNDSLRKKFDGLKYDLKKVEEVVYDLSIRGLKPAAKGE